MNSVRVIDDFLDKEEFEKIYHMITDEHNFPWYIAPSSDHDNDNNTQLYHMLYNNNVPFSDYFSNFSSVFNKLQVFSLYKVRLIATMKFNNIENKYHTDVQNLPTLSNCSTAVFYLNDNNGGTQFEHNNKIVKSKENRMVIFPTHLKHRTVKHTTDLPFRYVLNINYMSYL